MFGDTVSFPAALGLFPRGLCPGHVWATGSAGAQAHLCLATVPLPHALGVAIGRWFPPLGGPLHLLLPVPGLLRSPLLHGECFLIL